MQSGYGEQTLFYKFFSFIIEKILFVQWFHFRKTGFVIFLTRATKTDFFEIGWWNYLTIASNPHIPFLWSIFLRLGSSSSCCERFFFACRESSKNMFDVVILNANVIKHQMWQKFTQILNHYLKCERWFANFCIDWQKKMQVLSTLSVTVDWGININSPNVNVMDKWLCE